MNKKIRIKLTQLVMLGIIVLQTLTPSVQCSVNAKEQMPMYVVKPTVTSQMTQDKLSALLKNSPVIPSDYTISEPVALYVEASGNLVEDHYYPIVSKGKIAGLIRYHTETDSYEMEKEAVVKAFHTREFMTAATSGLLLLDLDGAIIAKDVRGSYNLSDAEMTTTDTQNLVAKVDLTKLNLEHTQDIYTPNQTLTAKPTEGISEPTVDPQGDAKAVDETKVTSQAENQAVVDVLNPETEAKQVWQKQTKGLTAPGALVRSTGPATVDYSKGLVAGTDYVLYSTYARLRTDNLYFLIKSKDGKYAYTQFLYTPDYRNVSIDKTGIDRAYYDLLGGNPGNGVNITELFEKLIQFSFKPDFYTYYANYDTIYQDAYQGKSLNELINWLNYWTDNKISIVKKNRSDIEHHVLNLNTGIKFKPGKVNYSKGLNATTDYNLSNDYARLKTDNLYFLIKSKDGKYAYTKYLYTPGYRNVYIDKTGIDRAYYEFLGGSPGNGINIGGYEKNAIQFRFKPDFYTYYASYSRSRKNPYQGKSLNDLINWLNFWTDNEISLVKESEIDLFVAEKNKAIKDWQFFKEGRTSSKDQFYSLSLDKTTRLNVSGISAPYQKLTVYNKQKQRYFEMTYTNFYGFSDVLDLPAGEYYISLTNVHNKTTFQMTKSLFSEYDLSVETSDDKTDVYLNNKFNQALTNIYKPFHKKSGNTVTDVFNRLAYKWRHDYKPDKALDQLFGSDHTVTLPQLKQLKIKNLGALPLGNSLRTQSMQYIGKNNFYSNNTIFQTRFTPQQRIIGVDDLVVIGVFAGIALYAAYNISQTQTSSSMTVSMPSLQLPSFGSWSGDDDFEYQDTFAYGSKTYGINENTGEIKDINSGEDFPEQIISKAFRAEIPKVSTQAIRQAVLGAKIDIPNGYRWYTVKDLIEDESADWQSSGGHTIAKHISKSDSYLINRAKTTNVSIASSYDTVLQALIAINIAKINNVAQFTSVSTKQVFSVQSVVAWGRGFDKEGACYDKLKNATVVILPDKSQKGFRVQTSYPTR